MITKMYQCQRCKNESNTEGWESYTEGWYCERCGVGSVEVDFDIEEENTNWKGQVVCLWCYLQLVLKAE